MSFEQLADLFGIGESIVECEAPWPCMLSLLMQGRLQELVKVLCGPDAMEKDVLTTVAIFRRKAFDMAVPYFKTIKICGGEDVCGVLYEYRPRDLKSLFLLIKKRQKEEFKTRYIADLLRLIVLSKSREGSSIPTLDECLTRKPAPVEQSGQDIMEKIIAAALGKTQEE